MSRTSLTTVIAITLTLFLGTSAFGTSSDQSEDTTPITRDDCMREWGSSSAIRSCSQRPKIRIVNNRCNLKFVWCKTGYLSSSVNRITVALDDVADLNNCNGVLTLNSC